MSAIENDRHDGHKRDARHVGSLADESNLEELRRVAIFSDVADDDLKALATRSQRRECSRDDVVLREQEERDGLFAVVEGCVREARSAPDGREVTVDELPSGEIFGLAYLALEAASLGTVEVEEDGTTLWHIPRDVFRQLAESHPDVGVRALEALGRRVARISDRLQEVALYPGEARVAHDVALEARSDPECRVRSTHRQIAARTGTTQQQVTRHLKRFRDEGWIASRPHGRGFVVLDVEMLANYGKEV